MLTLTTAPIAQPVTLAEAKAHLRVTASDEDTLITALVQAATEGAEHLMQRAVMPQTWTLTLSSFNDPTGYRAGSDAGITLQRPIVTAVSSVKYLQASDGVLTTLNPSLYVAELGGPLYGRVVPAYGTSWPDTRDMPSAVQIAFVCGWPDAASVPAMIKAWIKLRVGALFENREQWTMGKAIEPNPHIDRLLDAYRVPTV